MCTGCFHTHAIERLMGMEYLRIKTFQTDGTCPLARRGVASRHIRPLKDARGVYESRSRDVFGRRRQSQHHKFPAGIVDIAHLDLGKCSAVQCENYRIGEDGR